VIEAGLTKDELIEKLRILNIDFSVIQPISDGVNIWKALPKMIWDKM